MNRSVQVEGRQFNQIAWLHQAGYLQEAPPDPDSLARLADLRDSEAEVEHRVRSYLAANCVQCHQAGGTGRGFWDARFTVSLADTSLIDTVPMDDLGDPENRLIKPGSLEQSVLYQRVAQIGPHHMPPLATRVVNDQAVDLLADWIQNVLPGSNSGLEITDIRLSAGGWIELALRTEIDQEPELETSTNLEDWEPVSEGGKASGGGAGRSRT
jgi:mono/diheme cytochrome c family protein